MNRDSNVNPFLERYRKLTNEQLVNILLQSSDYQPLALEAVQTILSERNITEEEKDAYVHKINEKHALEQRKKTTINNSSQSEVLDTDSNILDTYIQTTYLSPTHEKIIQALCIVFGGNALYSVYKMVFDYVNDIKENWDTNTNFLSLALTTLIPVAFYYLWKIRKIGWQIVVVYFTINAISAVFSLFNFIKYNQYSSPTFNPLTDFAFIRYICINLFGTLFGCYFLLKPEVFSAYNILRGEEKKMIFIGMALFIFTNIFYFFYYSFFI